MPAFTATNFQAELLNDQEVVKSKGQKELLANLISVGKNGRHEWVLGGRTVLLLWRTAWRSA